MLRQTAAVSLLALAGVLTASGEPGGESTAADGRATARRLASQLRSPRASAERLAALVDRIVAIGPEGSAAVASHVDREFERLSAVVESRPKTGPLDDEIEALRDTLRQLRQAADLSKERLESVGLPALESLTVAWSRREAVLAPWRQQREVARGQAERLGGVVDAWRAKGGDAGDRSARLAKLLASLGPEDAAAARVAAENEKVARGLPADVVPGMQAVNTIRTTCGLPPLVFDPRLCEAATMHSRDMESQRFFSHQSPLPGKKTPQDRAKLAGTAASGENIYMGSSVGSDAIKAWFLSPGHHKNMLGERYARQGLGRSGKHWTQLFGG